MLRPRNAPNLIFPDQRRSLCARNAHEISVFLNSSGVMKGLGFVAHAFGYRDYLRQSMNEKPGFVESDKPRQIPWTIAAKHRPVAAKFQSELLNQIAVFLFQILSFGEGRFQMPVLQHAFGCRRNVCMEINKLIKPFSPQVEGYGFMFSQAAHNADESNLASLRIFNANKV